MIVCVVNQVNTVTETHSDIQQKTPTLASQLPESRVVMKIFGVGEILEP